MIFAELWNWDNREVCRDFRWKKEKKNPGCPVCGKKVKKEGDLIGHRCSDAAYRRIDRKEQKRT